MIGTISLETMFTVLGVTFLCGIAGGVAVSLYVGMRLHRRNK